MQDSSSAPSKLKVLSLVFGKMTLALLYADFSSFYTVIVAMGAEAFESTLIFMYGGGDADISIGIDLADDFKALSGFSLLA